jgi:hypothetical protein
MAGRLGDERTRGRHPAGGAGRFHDRNPQACPGKVAGRDEPVVPGPDHDHVDHRRQLIRLKRRRARR